MKNPEQFNHVGFLILSSTRFSHVACTMANRTLVNNSSVALLYTIEQGFLNFGLRPPPPYIFYKNSRPIDIDCSFPQAAQILLHTSGCACRSKVAHLWAI